VKKRVVGEHFIEDKSKNSIIKVITHVSEDTVCNKKWRIFGYDTEEYVKKGK
jgi:hypothetical protein